MNVDRSPPSFQTLAIISIAQHISILILILVTLFLAKQGKGGWVMGWRVQQTSHVIFLALLATAATMALLGLYYPVIAKAGKQDDMLNDAEVKGYKLFCDFQVVDAKLNSLTIVRMTLCESVAIFGFVLAILNQSFLVIVPFALLALVLQFMVGPIAGRFLHRP